MTNILLVFLNNLSKVDEFNKIIDRFAEQNYAMYLLDNIKDDEFFYINSLPELVEFYKGQHDDVNKIVVLSNSRDLLFSWYRCYNSMVDDFIYFIDEDEKNYFNPQDRHFDFYYNLYQFNGIDKEIVEGKIYLNINFNNYNKIIDFLIKDNKFKYFNSFYKYNFNETKIEKNNISKKYIFNGFKYSFELANAKNTETFKIYIQNSDKFKIDNHFIQTLLSNGYLIPYITVLFYKVQEESLTNLLLSIYKSLKKVDKVYQKDIFEHLYLYMNNNDIDFKERIYISSLLVMINNEDERLTEFIMKTLLEDVKYTEYHYYVLINILFYHTNESLKKYDTYEFDRRDIIRKLSRLNKVKLGLDNERISKNDIYKIIIVTDQLLNLYHSPTKTTLDIAKSIKTEYPNIKIKIIVEDNLYCKKAEKIIPYLFTSIESKECKSIHKSELIEHDIDIYYANNNINVTDKLSETIKKIDDFEPNVIFYTSPISLSVMSLLEYYPIVYISYNDFNFTIPSDIYLERSKKEVIKQNEKYNLININNVYEFIPSRAKYIGAKSKYIRENFRLNNNDFVMVTVGNRLDGEISDEFIDMVVDFVKDNDRVKWIIVGNCQLNYLKSKYIDIFYNKVIKINYEYDLPALYGICDIYLNPQRSTGGGSIFTAMYEGLPIVMLSHYSDVINHIGIENTCGYKLSDMKRELYKLYTHRNYRDAKSIAMKERVKLFEMKKNKDAQELWMYFNKAINNFRDRVENEDKK
ncbi:glycosyltransferase family 4 protein [Alkaliphilus sp. MSJ-5]|uniref:Glycosyltransferase family 4 protein n=1 Tax=Alkaliphilus flagellatus TaxID=2841507 RepID=A0ABS6G2S6_9FIRM|nr:glycosyltransferase family 4 protein [Alkaliphilus flagellatus]MBU5676668.1 glycosyltransferase family 4 protein [Alkaliphilus flagellatus]